MAAQPGGMTFRVVVVSNRFDEASAAAVAGVQKIIATQGYQLEAAAKAKAPVLTGTLRRSIHTVLSADRMSAAVGPSVDYGAPVEFGTRHMGARPYLRPAYELIAPKVVDDLKALLRGLR